MLRVHPLRLAVGRSAALSIALLFLFTLLPANAPALGMTVAVGHVQTNVAITPGTFPISHIVYVIMENHAYDNFFGVYCQKIGNYCPVTGNGIPSGICVNIVPGSASGGCIRPFALNQSYVTSSLGGSHNWGSSHKSYDNGLMDGFYAASPHVRQVMGYYNATTLPTYWNLAEQYGLGDNFFSPVLSYSLPEHWYALAGQAPVASEAPPSGAFTRQGVAAPLTGSEMQYLNESNATTGIDDELANSSTTWKYYDNSLMNASYSYALSQTVLGNSSLSSVFDYWNPLISKAETYQPYLASHFVPRSDFINDTLASRLPQVSWIIPANYQSDHPPDDLTAGESYIASILSAVQNSTYWNTTAIFVTWDEYGGYYDHVAPTQIDQYGLGFRVPLLVFSAYTPAGYISHTFSHFESVLAFDEWRFGLANLTARDGGANLPLDYFDVNATPRLPVTVSPGGAYPMAEQAQSLKRVAGLSVTTSATGANLTWTEASGGAPVAGFLVKWTPTKGHAGSMNVVRTQNSLPLTGLVCNTTYTFQVTAFAGSSRSPAATVSATTGSCVPMPIGAAVLHRTLPGALGEKARIDTPFGLRDVPALRYPPRGSAAPVPPPRASAFPSGR